MEDLSNIVVEMVRTAWLREHGRLRILRALLQRQREGGLSSDPGVGPAARRVEHGWRYATKKVPVSHTSSRL